jgi:hypothetical protein
MFVIKEEQIQHFIAANENEQVKVVVEALRKACGDRISEYDDKTLEKMAEIGIERARSRGLSKTQNIAAYVAIMFEIAPRFDEQAEVAAVFADKRFSSDVRFEQLFQRVSQQAWIEAGKLYDDSFWFPDGSVR